MESKIWVVTTEQHYANCFSVDCAFTNEADALEYAKKDSDFNVHEVTLNPRKEEVEEFPGVYPPGPRVRL